MDTIIKHLLTTKNTFNIFVRDAHFSSIIPYLVNTVHCNSSSAAHGRM